MPRSYLKFNLTSLFIGTLNIDGFKGKANFLETFSSEFFSFALYFNRIKTSFSFFSPEPQQFYFALFQDKAASEIKECVLSSRFVENTAADMLRSLAFSDVTSKAL